MSITNVANDSLLEIIDYSGNFDLYTTDKKFNKLVKELKVSSEYKTPKGIEKAQLINSNGKFKPMVEIIKFLYNEMIKIDKKKAKAIINNNDLSLSEKLTKLSSFFELRAEIKFLKIVAKTKQLPEIKESDDKKMLIALEKQLEGIDYSDIKHINLSCMKISVLPSRLKKLKNLEVIYLSSNNFTEFPDLSAHSKSLKIVHLNTNRIKEIPKEVKQYQSLIWCYLNENPDLKEIPEEFAEIPTLTVIGIDEGIKIPQKVKNHPGILWGFN